MTVALLFALGSAAASPNSSLRLGIFAEPQPFNALCLHKTLTCSIQPSGMIAASAMDSGLLDAAGHALPFLLEMPPRTPGGSVDVGVRPSCLP